jgi:hypothetical protein
LTANAANGVIFVLTSTRVGEVEDALRVSTAGCDPVRFV